MFKCQALFRQDLSNNTFGEIIDMYEEHQREFQVLCACSAQDPKLLPPPEISVQNVEQVKSHIHSQFDGN